MLVSNISPAPSFSAFFAHSIASMPVGVLPPFWLVGALAWLSHIVVDWGFDKGLRTTDGYLRGHSVPGGPVRGSSSTSGHAAPAASAS